MDLLWPRGDDDSSILRDIRQGFPESGMPPFEGVLSEDEMRGLLGHIRALSVDYVAGRIAHPTQPASISFKSELHDFRLETYVEGLGTPWGLAFLPDGGMLVTEREGRLRLIRDGQLDPVPIRDTPAVFAQQDGGLLDVAVHPDYAKQPWVYLAYSEAGPLPATAMTVIVRGQIHNGHWTAQEELFRAPPDRYYRSRIHFGCRFLFDAAGHLFFTIGDRGRPEDAQDLGSPCGKIHRILADGRVPADNPFVNQPGAWPTLWSLGNRHPQGLAFHPTSGKMWATEHGPTGGDELNRIERGHNYGWPVVSAGTDPRVQYAKAQAEMDPPRASWSPSVAPAGIAFYAADKFPRWKNHILVGCLGGEQLRRIETDGDRVVRQEILFKGMGRIRSVVVGPDGLPWVVMNTPGRIARLVPAP